MCFSLEASLGTSIVLLIAGTDSVRTALKKEWVYLPLSTFPLFFSLQQFTESLVWLGVEQHRPFVMKGAALVFLFFALFFWLVWTPLSVLLIEDKKSSRYILGSVCCVGIILGAVLYVPLLLDPDHNLSVVVKNHSIQYRIQDLNSLMGVMQMLFAIIYFFVVLSPLVLAREHPLQWFAISLAASAMISGLFYWYAFKSIWCFFSALVTIQLCYLLRKLPDDPRPAVAHAVPWAKEK